MRMQMRTRYKREEQKYTGKSEFSAAPRVFVCAELTIIVHTIISTECGVAIHHVDGITLSLLLFRSPCLSIFRSDGVAFNLTELPNLFNRDFFRQFLFIPTVFIYSPHRRALPISFLLYSLDLSTLNRSFRL